MLQSKEREIHEVIEEKNREIQNCRSASKLELSKVQLQSQKALEDLKHSHRREVEKLLKIKDAEITGQQMQIAALQGRCQAADASRLQLEHSSAKEQQQLREKLMVSMSLHEQAQANATETIKKH